MRLFVLVLVASCASAPARTNAPIVLHPPIVLHAAAKPIPAKPIPVKDDRSALWNAAEIGDLAAVKKLIAGGADIEAPAKPYGSPLMAALQFDHEDVAAELLAAGAKVDGDTLALAARGDHVALFPSILARGGSSAQSVSAALHAAAAQGQVASIQALLALKADVNTVADDGFTPLSSAMAKNHIEAAKLLLAAGARVNTATREGDTPLHWAVFAARATSIEYFPPRGGTPFHGPPILAPKAELVELMLAHKANVDAVDSSGDTPLLRAAKMNAPAAVRVLLAHGANRNATDADGNAAADIARTRGYSDVLRALAGK